MIHKEKQLQPLLMAFVLNKCLEQCTRYFNHRTINCIAIYGESCAIPYNIQTILNLDPWIIIFISNIWYNLIIFWWLKHFAFSVNMQRKCCVWLMNFQTNFLSMVFFLSLSRSLASHFVCNAKNSMTWFQVSFDSRRDRRLRIHDLWRFIRQISRTLSLFWLVQVLLDVHKRLFATTNPVNKMFGDDMYIMYDCVIEWWWTQFLPFELRYGYKVRWEYVITLMSYTKLKTHSNCCVFFSLSIVQLCQFERECSLANELDYVLDEDIHLMSLSFQS